MRGSTLIEILLAVTLMTATPLVMVAVRLQVHLAHLALAPAGAQRKTGVPNGNHKEKLQQNQKVSRLQGLRNALSTLERTGWSKL